MLFFFLMIRPPPGSTQRRSSAASDVYKRQAQNVGVPFSGDSQGGMFGFFLMNELPQNYAKVMTTDSPKFNKLFHGLLDRGVYIAPALYEAGFVSAAHSDADIAATVAAAQEVFKTLWAKRRTHLLWMKQLPSPTLKPT